MWNMKRRIGFDTVNLEHTEFRTMLCNSKVQASTQVNIDQGYVEWPTPESRMENAELDRGGEMANFDSMEPWSPSWESAKNPDPTETVHIGRRKSFLNLVDVNCLVRASQSAVGPSLGRHMATPNLSFNSTDALAGT